MNHEIGGHLWQTFITGLDFVLLPFYLLIVYSIAFAYRNKKYPKKHSYEHPWRKYFAWGFSLKIFGAVFIGLVYEFYYSGGDTSAFFYHAKVINQSITDSPIRWLNLIFRVPDVYDIEYYEYTNQMLWYNNQ